MFDVLNSWRARRRIHKTRQELYGLSDRTLTDIGLTRSAIRRIGRDHMADRLRR